MNKLSRPHIPDATYQFSFGCLVLKNFKEVYYHIWAWRASWSCEYDRFVLASKESPYES